MIPNRDRKLKIICCLVIVGAIALIPSIEMTDLQAREHEVFHVGLLNADFVKFCEERREPLYGYIPPPMNLSHLDDIPVEGLLKSGTLPASFDWRDQDKVTSVKDQGMCGTCWVFGTTSVLESAVLIGENTTYDFSEQSVALCVDRSWVYLYDDSDEPCGITHGGGWSALAAEVFIKKGAVLESCSPYDIRGLTCDGTCACDNCTGAKVVDGYRYVTDDQSQTGLIKEAVYSQGPVIMAYYNDGAYLDDDPTYGAVYDCATCASANHLVSIIGWDDSVPHFETPGTGAWLVKNSWGTDFGNSGYFWLAYDSSCMQEIAYLEYKDYDPDEKLYYWDEAGIVNDFGYGDPSAWMASIFNSTQDGILTHVDFWTTSSNAQYEIHVYLDGDILDGLDYLATLQSGTCQESGYYSVPLGSPVWLTSGQPFVIAVKMTTPGYDEPIPVEEVIWGFVQPTIQVGVSYARSGDSGPWEDLASDEYNACLRARVRTEEKLAILTTHLSDGVVAKAYQETMEATGGVPPYTWEASGLPDGLNCSAAGVISGNPTEDGDFTVTVNVTDNASNCDSTDLTLKIYAALEIAITGLPEGESGEAYTATLEAAGGKTPYTWNATGLPSGLACSTAGVISGIPTDDGEFTVTVNVSDSFGPPNTDTADLALKVYPSLEISTTTLPDGESGEAYAANLEANGGKTPYAWNATGLPAGLTCSTGGTISGIPVGEVGGFNVTVAVADALTNVDSRGLTLTISCKQGDANIDGVVDTGDITKVKRIYFELDTQTPCANVNGDDMIDAGDITAIKIIYFS